MVSLWLLWLPRVIQMTLSPGETQHSSAQPVRSCYATCPGCTMPLDQGHLGYLGGSNAERKQFNYVGNPSMFIFFCNLFQNVLHSYKKVFFWVLLILRGFDRNVSFFWMLNLQYKRQKAHNCTWTQLKLVLESIADCIAVHMDQEPERKMYKCWLLIYAWTFLFSADLTWTL